MGEDERDGNEGVLAFGPFRLFPARQLLLEGDAPLPLGSRALAILVALVRQAGEVVAKDRLIAAAWPHAVVVDETNLRVNIAALRRALRDGRDGNRYVVTVAGRGYSFVAPLVASRSAARGAEAIPPAPSNLPFPLTRMIGRAGLVGALSAQVPQRRFVTLVGPGGIGKTTVALAIARELAASYRDGVRYVDLATISNPVLVPGTLAAVLGLAVHSESQTAALVAFLRQKQMLLVLDSCEHVIEAAAATAEELSRGAPGVHILATSREPLRAAGERVHRLAALESPVASAGITAAEAMSFPGVELFVERAASSAGDFTLDDADAPVVAEICRRLDGIALAIEIAASRVVAFGLRDLAARLDDRFRLLMSGRRTALPRHQTLAATLDWSYQLLAEPERGLLRRLAIFAGDFSLEAAIAVAPDRQASGLVGHVAELAAKSLVAADLRGDFVQYRLLDTTRLYSLEKLRASGEHRDAARAHAAFYRDFFAPAEAECETRPKPDWLARYGGQLDNMRAALDWAFSADGEAAIGVALTIAAVPLWVALSLMAECRRRVAEALAALPAGAPEADRADILRRRMQLSAALGWSRMFGGGAAGETHAAWTTTLQFAEALEDAGYRLRALWGLWVDRLNSGLFREAFELAQQFAGRLTEPSDAIDRTMADRMLATSLHFLGDQTAARTHIERLLGRYVPPANQAQIVRLQFDQRITAQYFRIRILWLQGFADQAMAGIESNVAEAQAIGNALSLGSVLGQGACPVALFTGDLAAAARYGSMLQDHAERHALQVWQSWARCFNALVSVRQGDVEGGLPILRAELEHGARSRFLPRYLVLIGELAMALGQAGELAAARVVVDDALLRCEGNEERWYLPELLRIKGDLIRFADAEDVSGAAEEPYRRALAWANRQGALSWELRVATSLARLRLHQGRRAEAHSLLDQVHRRFSEGFATADLRAAALLLAEPPELARRPVSRRSATN